MLTSADNVRVQKLSLMSSPSRRPRKRWHSPLMWCDTTMWHNSHWHPLHWCATFLRTLHCQHCFSLDVPCAKINIDDQAVQHVQFLLLISLSRLHGMRIFLDPDSLLTAAMTWTAEGPAETFLPHWCDTHPPSTDMHFPLVLCTSKWHHNFDTYSPSATKWHVESRLHVCVILARSDREF